MIERRFASPRPRWRGAAFAIALVAGLLLVGYAIASFAVYDRMSSVTGECLEGDDANTPERFSANGVGDEVTEPYWMPAPQDVEFRSRDAKVADLTLRAWWIPGARAHGPAVLLVHGYRTCRRDETVLMAAGMLHQAGFGVLLMDQRDHGDSDDEDLRFAGGTEEYQDVLGGWDWLVAQGIPAERIGIVGMSFGAATSLIAGGEEPRVQAVWADSSYADVEEAIPDFIAYEGLPRFLSVLTPGAELAARIVAGDDLTSKEPIHEIPAYAGRPVAIVHGLADTFVRPDQARELQAAAETAGVDLREFWLVPGVRHVRADIDRAAEYAPRLVGFFSDSLGAP